VGERVQRYRAVAQDIRRDIEQGTYPPGTRLPSRPKLRDKYHVSETVLTGAMRLLHEWQLIETQPGVGVYVRERGEAP
jgi:GntR family transcriptional regulator